MPTRIYRFARIAQKRVLLALWIAAAFAATQLSAQQEAARAGAEAVGTIGMVVSDMDRSVDFYSQVLTFEKVSDTEVYGDAFEHLEGLFGVRMRVVRMRLGDEEIELTEFLTPQGRPIPIDSRSNDRWFQHIAIITSDMDRAYQTLRDHKVKHASTAPQLLPGYIKNAAGIRAFYFRDPDNHFLEALQFPPDKGDAKWHQSSEHLFLGIDHTAIVVGDTDASLTFYRDTLGMSIAGESENYGTEQEHLNNIFGARLRITSLRAAKGPGIELLEYLAPGDGRPMPSDSHADDLWSWQTTIVTKQVDRLVDTILAAKYPLVSSGVVTQTDAEMGIRKTGLFRDPDGHLIRIVERSACQTTPDASRLASDSDR
jgi:catechol 2,3-dioxygenase-like lactoylglutathione lyase family enzyme